MQRLVVVQELDQLSSYDLFLVSFYWSFLIVSRKARRAITKTRTVKQHRRGTLVFLGSFIVTQVAACSSIHLQKFDLAAGFVVATTLRAIVLLI